MNKPPIEHKSDPYNLDSQTDYYKILAILLIAFGIVVVFLRFTYNPIERQTKKPGETIDQSEKEQRKEYWEISGTMGDFTAGIAGTAFSLAAFIYLYLSFKKQRESNDMQAEIFNHDKIEDRFFELIKLHRDNITEMTLTYWDFKLVKDKEHDIDLIDKTERTVSHRQVFKIILDQFSNAWEELGFFFSELVASECYCDDYLGKLKNNDTLLKRNVDLILYARIDIVYLVVFFGVGGDGRKTILSLTHGRYNRAFIEKVLDFAALKPKVESEFWEKWFWTNELANKYEIWANIIKKQKDQSLEFDNLKTKWLKRDKVHSAFQPFYPDNYEKYFGGHQFRLGHYFRHLFQSVSFINDEPSLTATEQYDYVKHLRGQLSTYEQILFFLNSLSQLGRVWELEEKLAGRSIAREKQLVSDYKLIKNIPTDYILNGIQLTHFYPNIDYEGFASKILDPTSSATFEAV